MTKSANYLATFIGSLYAESGAKYHIQLQLLTLGSLIYLSNEEKAFIDK